MADDVSINFYRFLILVFFLSWANISVYRTGYSAPCVCIVQSIIGNTEFRQCVMVTSFPKVLFSSNKKFNCSGIPSILNPKILRFLTVEKEWKIHRHVLLSTWCHAHCLFDSVFAVLKKLYRRSYVDWLDQLEMIVNCSSTTNTTVRYPRWQWRDWQTLYKLCT